jgi:hypothetical protein
VHAGCMWNWMTESTVWKACRGLDCLLVSGKVFPKDKD